MAAVPPPEQDPPEAGAATVPGGMSAGWWRRPLIGLRAADPLLLAVMAFALAAGVALRWWVLTGPLGYLDLDEATAGIAADRFFTSPLTFFPRQAYGGTLEVALLAVVVKVQASTVALKVVPIVLHGLAAVISWRAARRLVDGVAGQLTVPIVLWCAPAFGIWESTKERGFYGMTIVLASAIVALVLRVADEPTTRNGAALGLSVGLAAWTSPLLALVALPALGWLVVRSRPSWRVLPAAAAAAVVGAAPWLVWNLRNGWRSLEQPASLGQTTVDRLQVSLGKFPALVGLATPWDPGRTLVPAVGWVAGLGFVAALVVATIRTRRRAPGLLAVLVVGYAVLAPLAKPTGTVGPDLRYLYPLLPVLALVLGALVPDVQQRVARAGLLAGVVVVASLTSWWGLSGLRDASEDAGDTLFLSAPGIEEVVARLEERGVERVTTELAGAQITFASDGRVRGASFGSPRFDDLEAEMLVDAPTTYVFDLSRTDFDNSARLERTLEERGIGFEREQYGTWAIYYLDEWLPPWEAGLVAYGGRVPEPDGT